MAPIANAAFVVVVNAGAGINSLQDLITQGKQGKLNFASAGSGTPQHIIGEMFNVRAGTKIQHVPYKGSGPAMNDLLGGQVPVAFENPVPAMPHVKAGKLKVLAVTGASRSVVFPDIPTVAESGLPGFDAKPWYGFLAPAGLSPEIAGRLNQAIREAVGTAEFKARLFELGAEPMSMSPAEFHAFAQTELDSGRRWSKHPGRPWIDDVPRPSRGFDDVPRVRFWIDDVPRVIVAKLLTDEGEPKCTMSSPRPCALRSPAR